MLHRWSILSLLIATTIGCGSQEFNLRHRDRSGSDEGGEEGTALTHVEKKRKKEKKSRSSTPATPTKTPAANSNASAAAPSPAVGNSRYTSLLTLDKGLALEVVGSSQSENAPVRVAAFANGANQKFTLQYLSDSSFEFRIVAAHSGKCLQFGAAKSSYPDRGLVPLVQRTCSNGASQVFSVANQFDKHLLSGGRSLAVARNNAVVRSGDDVCSAKGGCFKYEARSWEPTGFVPAKWDRSAYETEQLLEKSGRNTTITSISAPTDCSKSFKNSGGQGTAIQFCTNYLSMTFQGIPGSFFATAGFVSSKALGTGQRVRIVTSGSELRALKRID